MSENAPAPAAAEPERKRTSGLLWLSLFSSLGFYMLGILTGPMALSQHYGLLGIMPAGGLLLGILGFRAVRKAPELIGPKFAAACIVVAVITLGHQSYLRYKMYPVILSQKAVGAGQDAFLAAIQKDDLGAVHDAMGPSYKRAHTIEETTAVLKGALPKTGRSKPKGVEFRPDGFFFEMPGATLLSVVDAVQEAQGIGRELMLQKVEEALLSAAKSDNPSEKPQSVKVHRDSGEVQVFDENQDVMQIDLGEVALEVAKRPIFQLIVEREMKRFQDFLEGERAIYEVTLPLRIEWEDDATRVKLHFRLVREGRTKVDAELFDFDVEREPKPKEAPADTPATGTGTATGTGGE